MRFEAFSLGKKFGQPEANEDSFVVIPGAGYAVIDGVTDRTGTRYAGMLSGQFASRTVKRATERFLLEQQASTIAEGFAYEPCAMPTSTRMHWRPSKPTGSSAPAAPSSQPCTSRSASK